MHIEILKDDLEERISRAIELGASGDYVVLGELSKRFPDATFHRKSLPDVDTERTFSGKDVRACYDEKMEMRPSV